MLEISTKHSQWENKKKWKKQRNVQIVTVLNNDTVIIAYIQRIRATLYNSQDYSAFILTIRTFKWLQEDKCQISI
jgi:hypothetical protein